MRLTRHGVMSGSYILARGEMIDRPESIYILRSGPSAPNGGRSSVRMGVRFDDANTAAGRPSG